MFHPAYVRAGDGTRTRDIKLGRLALYQLSYSRVVLMPCPAVPSAPIAGAPPPRAARRVLQLLLPW